MSFMLDDHPIPVEASWQNASRIGGCNGCDSREMVLRIRLRTTEVRVCNTCWKQIKMDAAP